MIRLFTLPFRMAFGSVRLGYRAGRVVGPSRALFFGLGFGTGVLLVSPKARGLAFGVVGRVSEAVADARRVEPTPAVPVDEQVLPAE